MHPTSFLWDAITHAITQLFILTPGVVYLVDHR